MEHCNYELAIEPTESRIALSEHNAYTFRVPLGVLRKNDKHLLQVMIDTANVAFGHNSPDNRTVTITCPANEFGNLYWLITGLQKRNFNVEIKEQPDSRFVDFRVIINCGLGCVDRRLDDEGYDPISKTAQITHAGGALVLHPKLEREMPPHHIASLMNSLTYAALSGAPVSTIDYHFGAEGGAGCGMYAHLSSLNPSIRETLRTPGDVVDMLKSVRDKMKVVLATDCSLTGSVVHGNSDVMVYNLDDLADVRALMGEKDIKL